MSKFHRLKHTRFIDDCLKSECVWGVNVLPSAESADETGFGMYEFARQRPERVGVALGVASDVYYELFMVTILYPLT
jgi:hypothetical protein